MKTNKQKTRKTKINEVNTNKNEDTEKKKGTGKKRNKQKKGEDIKVPNLTSRQKETK